MPVETATYVSELSVSDPPGTDFRKQGDDHLRLIKTVLKASFPNASKAFYIPDYVSKTTTYAALASDQNRVIGCDTSGGAWTLTLPSLAAGLAGWATTIMKTEAAANDLTIVPASGTINGAASLVIDTQYEFVEVLWTGTTWLAKVGSNITASANGLSLIAAANYAAMRALLDLEAGTDFNAYSADLAAIVAAGNWKVFYTDGSGVPNEVALGADGTVLTSTGAAAPPAFEALPTSGITLVAEQASTSGTAINFGSIPAGVKRITVMLDQVSFTTNGVTVLLQIGDAGGIETSGYEQAASKVTSVPATTFITSSTGFALAVTGSNNSSYISGQCILNRQDGSHTWTASWAIAGSAVGTAHVCTGGGVKQLSDELTQLEINGATFDAGSISISYE